MAGTAWDVHKSFVTSPVALGLFCAELQPRDLNLGVFELRLVLVAVGSRLVAIKSKISNDAAQPMTVLLLTNFAINRNGS